MSSAAIAPSSKMEKCHQCGAHHHADTSIEYKSPTGQLVAFCGEECVSLKIGASRRRKQTKRDDLESQSAALDAVERESKSGDSSGDESSGYESGEDSPKRSKKVRLLLKVLYALEKVADALIDMVARQITPANVERAVKVLWKGVKLAMKVAPVVLPLALAILNDQSATKAGLARRLKDLLYELKADIVSIIRAVRTNALSPALISELYTKAKEVKEAVAKQVKFDKLERSNAKKDAKDQKKMSNIGGGAGAAAAAAAPTPDTPEI